MNIRIVRSSRNGKSKIIGGSIIAAVFGVATLGCIFSGDIGELFALAVFCALIAMGGVSMIVKGVQMNKQIKSATQATHIFDEDAPDFVKERLNELMFEGNVKSTTVSRTVKRVTYTDSDGNTRTTETVTESGGNTAPKGYEPRNYQPGAVTCEACGGVNKLRKGQSGVCEYCGSHIQG